MKFTWEESDIKTGRIVCKHYSYQANDHFIPTGNSVKWTMMIGYAISNSGEKAKYLLINLGDGHISRKYTKEELIENLNIDAMIPMPEDWLIETMKYIRSAYGHEKL